MNLNDLVKNLNPEMLSHAIGQMGNVLTPEQMESVKQAIQSTDKGSLDARLNSLSADDLKHTLKTNPNIAKQLANNPELMNKINSIFKK